LSQRVHEALVVIACTPPFRACSAMSARRSMRCGALAAAPVSAGATSALAA